MSTPARHPLEPLSAQEVQQAVGLLKAEGKITPTMRFVSVSLKEPKKALVHGWSGKQDIAREAFAVLFDNALNTCYEATIALTAGKLLSWKAITGVQPT